MSKRRLAAPFRQQTQNRCRGFFDRAAGYIDARPIVASAELAGKCNLLCDRLAVDILIVVVVSFETEKSILSDLNDTLRAGVKADHQGA